MPASSIAARTVSTRSLLAQLERAEVDVHGAHDTPPPAFASSCQRLACRHASRSTKRPIATIIPVSSASGMNSAGMIVPRSGCSQRTSASAAAASPVASATIGW